MNPYTLENPPQNRQQVVVADPCADALYSRIVYSEFNEHSRALLTAGLLFHTKEEATAKSRLMLALGNERVLNALISLRNEIGDDEWSAQGLQRFALLNSIISSALGEHP